MWKLTGNNAATQPGHTLLPALIFLFVISYGLLPLRVVELGWTIW
mgnify:CR=1 FL=1